MPDVNNSGSGDTKNHVDRDARVTFLGLKFNKLLLLGAAQNEGYFWWVEK